MLVLIRGAGDLATGIALRLWRSGMEVVMTDLPKPTAIRRTVCFSSAITEGSYTVEDVTAKLAHSPEDVPAILAVGQIPVLADPDCTCRTILCPGALVDAILAKKNLGTRITDAPIVVGVGPGFTVGTDCHAVVETMRGHYLGRVILEGSATPNTGIPGLIGGFAGERVLRAPADGEFRAVKVIGDAVQEGDIAGFVGDMPMLCTLTGILRGILSNGIPVHKGMKAGDIDPRCEREHCFTASDKASAVGGGVLEAILRLSRQQHSPDRCPCCGNDMQRGSLETGINASGIFFLPESTEFPHSFVSGKSFEKRGGVVLDGPYHFRFHSPSAPAKRCKDCHKILIDYEKEPDYG